MVHLIEFHKHKQKRNIFCIYNQINLFFLLSKQLIDEVFEAQSEILFIKVYSDFFIKIMFQIKSTLKVQFQKKKNWNRKFLFFRNCWRSEIINLHQKVIDNVSNLLPQACRYFEVNKVHKFCFERVNFYNIYNIILYLLHEICAWCSKTAHISW